LIVNTGLSITDYFKKMMTRKDSVEVEEPPKKKSKKNKIDQLIEMEENRDSESMVVDHNEPAPEKKKKKKKRESSEVEMVQDVPEAVDETKHEKKKRKKEVVEEEQTAVVEEELSIKKKKKKSKAGVGEVPENKPVEEVKLKKQKDDDDRPRGANAVYSTDVIQLPSHIANKMSNVNIEAFSNSNIGDIVGYGMTEDVEIKVVETKIGAKTTTNMDKYALYNTDKMQTKRVNPRKIKTKLKKTKKSIQLI
jgi:Pin2-interacting protein X1